MLIFKVLITGARTIHISMPYCRLAVTQYRFDRLPTLIKKDSGIVR